MGYYMNAGGCVILKKSIEDDDALIDEILGYAKKHDLENCIDDTTVNGDLAIDIVFDGKYHEEDWTGFLGDIAKYAASGEIECVGEDSSHWRYRFDGKEFVEEYGEVTYKTGGEVDAAGREPWIISIANTAAENTVIQKVYGNIQEVKAYLAGLAAEDRENGEEEPEYGSDVQEEKYTNKSVQYVELCTYNCYSDYHIDYKAVPERVLEVKDLSMPTKRQENETEYEEERE